jgi:hypothetical protein
LTGPAFNLEKAVERIIWQRYAPAALVVDAGLHVLHFEGNTGPYLAPARGAATLHVLKLVRKELVLDLHTALHRAKKEEAPVRREGIRFPQDGESKTVNLEVIPIERPTRERRGFPHTDRGGSGARSGAAAPSQGGRRTRPFETGAGFYQGAFAVHRREP